MQTIRKYFKSIKQAEKYQYNLYSKWDYVRLSEYPSFTFNGWYQWEVSSPI